MAIEIDVSNAAELHERLKVSYTTIIVKAAAKALVEAPLLNASLEGDNMKVFEDVNIGVAVATENGLVVPVIRNADRKTLKEIDAEVVELTDKAKEAKLTKEEVSWRNVHCHKLGHVRSRFFHSNNQSR